MTLPDLIPLHDGRPGLRAQLSVSVSAPPEAGTPSTASPISLPEDQGPGGTGPCQVGGDEGRRGRRPYRAEEGAVLDFIASDESLDRYGEIISASGWSLANYRRNPVFQNAHQYGDILHTLGKALITEVRSVSAPGGTSSVSPCLFQRVEFAIDVNPVARIAYGLYKGGFLNAVSVGFIPLRWQDADTLASPSRANLHRRYLEQELLEVSAVAIPANPAALALALKSGALAKSDLQGTLDLLRSVLSSSSSVPSSSFSFSSSPSSRSDGERAGARGFLTPELFQLARELRRILRRS